MVLIVLCRSKGAGVGCFCDSQLTLVSYTIIKYLKKIISIYILIAGPGICELCHRVWNLKNKTSKPHLYFN